MATRTSSYVLCLVKKGDAANPEATHEARTANLAKETMMSAVVCRGQGWEASVIPRDGKRRVKYLISSSRWNKGSGRLQAVQSGYARHAYAREQAAAHPTLLRLCMWSNSACGVRRSICTKMHDYTTLNSGSNHKRHFAGFARDLDRPQLSAMHGAVHVMTEIYDLMCVGRVERGNADVRLHKFRTGRKQHRVII